MQLLHLALKSVGSRRITAILTILSIAMSTGLLLGVEKIRGGARSGFEQTVSGTDLIVGARSGAINLLLYSVFRLGDATANVSWETYQRFAERSDVAWTVPVSLGDSHRGYRVMGTTPTYFDHYQYGARQPLSLSEGVIFNGVFDAVIGAEAARTLEYALGDDILISHGLRSAAFAEHKDRPFRIVGILNPTGTPVDRTIHISLEGLEAVHLGWQSGAPPPLGAAALDIDIETVDLSPDSITAFFVGMKSKAAVLRIQRDANTYPREALSAVIPGVALAQLWRVVGSIEIAMRAISALVVAAGLMGMLTAILTSLNERRREIAVLRAVGAGAPAIFRLLVAESALIALAGAALGAIIVNAALVASGELIESRFGVPLGALGPSPYDLLIVGIVAGLGLVLGFAPGWFAYRNSLADGLTIKL